MQWESNDVYNKVAKDTGKDEAFIKALGNFVQKKLVEELKQPRKLIISVKGIGRWFLRRKRMQDAYDKFVVLNPDDYIVDTGENGKERKMIWERNLKVLKERLDDYIPFLERKQEVKIKKNEYQKSRQDNT
jgi:hypothetical protein